MSRHEIVDGNYKFVFGWDQPLQSFFLQIHSSLVDHIPDYNPIMRFGADRHTSMYEVEDLEYILYKYGRYRLSNDMQKVLYQDKDDGR
jgi:hypothetical protein